VDPRNDGFLKPPRLSSVHPSIDPHDSSKILCQTDRSALRNSAIGRFLRTLTAGEPPMSPGSATERVPRAGGGRRSPILAKWPHFRVLFNVAHSLGYLHPQR
jgi:hypothetical protein